MGRKRLSEILAEQDSYPLRALVNAVSSAVSKEGCAMVDSFVWWDVDDAAASRVEWAWALVYLLEWVRRG